MSATEHAHSPTPEELMAFLDGETSAQEREAIETHVVACAECRRVISDLGGVNRAMASWQPESAPPALRPTRVPRLTRWPLPAFSWRPSYLAISLGGLAASALLVVSLATDSRRARSIPEVATISAHGVSVVNGPVRGEQGQNGSFGRGFAGGGSGGRPEPATRAAGNMKSEMPTPPPPTAGGQSVAAPRQPSVVRTATLRLVASDFNAARVSVETIVAQAGGFLDQITVNGGPGAARTLTGSVRVPAARLGDTLTRLRQLGQATEDTQGSEDVTDQLVDLDARLANARATEQRLNDILKNRTGKLSDVLEVEQEISRVRLEIERMDAERVNMGRRVTYATIALQIDEERKAGLGSGPISLTTRLRVAAADGLEAALESVVGTGLFVLRAGPAALVWLAAGLFAWRTGRRILRLKTEPTSTRT